MTTGTGTGIDSQVCLRVLYKHRAAKTLANSTLPTPTLYYPPARRTLHALHALGAVEAFGVVGVAAAYTAAEARVLGPWHRVYLTDIYIWSYM